ncbi:hypothetical protein E1264_40780 [Actinomadura sp. KC216]|uniref:hypothetical protein n=1 Tax=Actinomadura sp. KC216 TaxID=2530370 RepID=UPI00104B9DCE|nr:hypothetical protein [Actinomadura sp. KC216]TDB74586.1 hypothetical protein E1264_40780 [Actinomadura sp. KC216]
MNLDGVLAAAASAIVRMPEDEFAVSLVRLQEEFRRRQYDDIASARHAAFVDSLELDRGAYELGRRHEIDGDLAEAARWYRVAARSDHADASLRLGRTLDLLAEQCAATGPYSAQREELHLITEAARAYAEAYAAGYPEAADRIDEMLAAFTHRQRLPEPGRPRPEDEPDVDRCAHVRGFAPANGVLTDEEIQELSRHAAQCMSCLEDFVDLVRAAAAATPTGAVSDPYASAL